MDTLAPTSRKSAAKCDTSCELQGSANHEILERTLRLRDRLEACLFERRLTVINTKTGFLLIGEIGFLRVGFECSGSFLLSETLDHSKYSNIWSRAIGFHEETASL